LYPHMKVYDNMAYGLRNRGMDKDEIDRRVRDAAATLGLAELLERRPRELSGGQRQRVAMGRAIVRSPKAFLFDEPLSNLDAKLRGQMRIEIKNLQRSLGVTSVYVTHDQVEAMTLADTLVVIDVQPASIFVACFVWSLAMSLLAAEGGEQGKGLMLAAGGTLKPSATSLSEAGRMVLLGVRPEHLMLVSARNKADIEMKVTAV